MAPTFLKFRPFESSYRYYFVDPDTKHEYEAFSQDALIKQIVSYREQNRLEPIEELPSVVEHYLCSLPENAGRCSPSVLARGLFQTIRGGIALLTNVFYGAKAMVPDEVAESRAAICIGCPHNVFPDKKGFVRFADRLAEASTGGRRIPSYDKLGSCEICTCVLRAKVFKKPPFDMTKEELSKLPSFCWVLKEPKT